MKWIIMKAKCVDGINGNDDVGDGSRTNPYRTIAKAIGMAPETREFRYSHRGEKRNKRR